MAKLNKAERFVKGCKDQGMDYCKTFDRVEKKTGCQQMYADVPKHVPPEYRKALDKFFFADS